MTKKGQVDELQRSIGWRAHFAHCGIKLDQLSNIIFYSNTANLMSNDEKLLTDRLCVIY